MKTTRGILRSLRSASMGSPCLPGGYSGGYSEPSLGDILDMRRAQLATELVKIGAEKVIAEDWPAMAQLDAAMVLYPDTEDDSEKGAPE